MIERMSRKSSPLEAKAIPDTGPKTTAERHAELERAGHIHPVEGTAGRAKFPLGVRRLGALKRFLDDRG